MKVTARTLGLPDGMDVEAFVLTVAAAVALTIVLLDFVFGSARTRRKTTLDAKNPTKKVALRLESKTELSHDTYLFRFALPSPEHVLGLPIGQHVALSYIDDDGKEQSRPYTPTSSDVDRGRVDFVIKVYFKCDKFPDGGKVSQRMHALKVGDTMDFQGPKGRFEYRGRGVFAIKRLKSQGGGHELRRARRVGMIAGGTGITPMLQVMRAAFRDQPGDATKLSLLFANQTEDDILLKDELDACERDHENFVAHYTIDKAKRKGWTGSTGFVTAEMIKEHMPPPGPYTQILLCGPPPMMKYAVLPAFEKLGYTKEMFLQW